MYKLVDGTSVDPKSDVFLMAIPLEPQKPLAAGCATVALFRHDSEEGEKFYIFSDPALTVLSGQETREPKFQRPILQSREEAMRWAHKQIKLLFPAP